VVMIFDEDPALICDAEAVRAQFGAAAFTQAWAAGQAMSREQAIAYALEDHAASTAVQADPLNARELEVLALVADGLSNREIAGQLFVSVNTVKWYLKGIFSKLEVSSRTEAVTRAQVQGLLHLN
jgi:ATP/maltotriose-dependent transcriptional regulator MalT